MIIELYLSESALPIALTELRQIKSTVHVASTPSTGHSSQAALSKTYRLVYSQRLDVDINTGF